MRDENYGSLEGGRAFARVVPVDGSRAMFVEGTRGAACWGHFVRASFLKHVGVLEHCLRRSPFWPALASIQCPDQRFCVQAEVHGERFWFWSLHVLCSCSSLRTSLQATSETLGLEPQMMRPIPFTLPTQKPSNDRHTRTHASPSDEAWWPLPSMISWRSCRVLVRVGHGSGMCEDPCFPKLAGIRG